MSPTPVKTVMEFFHGERDLPIVSSWIFLATTLIFSPMSVKAAEAAKDLSAEEAALNDAVEELRAVNLAASYLRGPALHWWCGLYNNGLGPRTWAAFEAAIKAQFVPVNAAMTARDELYKLYQGRMSVGEFLNKFRQVVMAIPDMPEQEKAYQLYRGFSPAIRLEIAKEGRWSLQEMEQIAFAVGDSMALARGFVGRTEGVPMELGAVSAPRSVRGPVRRPPPPRRPDGRTVWAPACYRCGQSGHIQRNCKAPQQSTLAGNYARAARRNPQ